MNSLEDQLASAAEEAHRQVGHVQTRPAASVRSRMYRHKALAGAAVAAGVFGLLGATAVIANYNEPASGFAAAPSTSVTAVAPSTTATDPSPATTVAATPVSTIAPEATSAAPQAFLPRFGLVSDDWAVVRAYEDTGGSGTTLIYEGNPNVYGGPARIAIESVAEFPGEEPGTGYQHTLSNLEASETPLDDVTLGSGTTAKTFTFTDSNSGDTGYYFLWQYSDTIAVHVIAYVDDYADAAAIVATLQPLSDFEWNDILDGQADNPRGTTAASTTTTPSDG